MTRKSLQPKLYKDIITLDNSNWKITSAQYHSKKKENLWMTVGLKDLNTYDSNIEEYKETLYTMVLFVNGEYEQINWICHNGNRMLENISQVDNSILEMIIAGAKEIAKEYI